jgi:uncharacterized protein YjbI with pentapeptide repeats
MELRAQQSARSPVRPRVIEAGAREPIPMLVEDAIERYLDGAVCGSIRISGPRGSGKSTALRAIASAIGVSGSVVLFDEPGADEVRSSRDAQLVVYTTAEPFPLDDLARYEMAPWSRDELIEYLLAAHPDRCSSVMNRLTASGSAALLRGSPALSAIVLGIMAHREDVDDVLEAVEAHVASLSLSPKLERFLGTLCAEAVPWFGPASSWRIWFGTDDHAELVHDLVSHRAVQVVLGAAHLACLLDQHGRPACLERPLAPDLVNRAARIVQKSFPARMCLRELASSNDVQVHPSVVALLDRADPNGLLSVFAKRHEQNRGLPSLRGVQAPGAFWPNLFADQADISGANLRGADLSRWRGEKVRAAGAKLERAKLSDAHLPELEATGASFAGADLCRVHLERSRLDSADLRNAKLAGAALWDSSLCFSALDGADFSGADLERADFTMATVEGATFVGANCGLASFAGVCLRKARLDGASFFRAHLQGCDLERVELSAADFRSADLCSALLTRSSLRGANLSGAKLCSAGLAGVCWEGADLRKADFAHASFHLGSSRSGLVFHAAPMEGSRTGFYTDEFRDCGFKSPEEVRKANLRFVDLREAKIEDCDFYLVDVRGAKLSPGQRAHLRRSGAILDDEE